MATADGRVANRYAKALIQGVPMPSLDDMRHKLTATAEVWSANLELQAAVLNPAVPEKTRVGILFDIAEKIAPADKSLSNLLGLLLENKRLSLLPEVALTFGNMVDELKKQTAVEITSAFQISDSEKDALIGKIKTQFGDLAQVSWAVDPAILGGLVVRCGDKLLDSSVKGALNQVQDQLKF